MDTIIFGTNGARYSICNRASDEATPAKPHVHVTHPDHEARVIVGGYNGERFASMEQAYEWASADSRLTYAPGEQTSRRAGVGR
jgi:hypothetical protein